MDYSVDATKIRFCVVLLLLPRLDTKIESNIKPSSSLHKGGAFSLSLCLSRSLARSRGFVFVFQVASRPFSSPCGGLSSSSSSSRNLKRGSYRVMSICRPARRRRRRRRRRLHSARTSVPRRRAGEDRERFCFRWSRGFGKLEEGSRLVSICISLFLFGCYFFLSLIHRVAKIIYLYSREERESSLMVFFLYGD